MSPRRCPRARLGYGVAAVLAAASLLAVALPRGLAAAEPGDVPAPLVNMEPHVFKYVDAKAKAVSLVGDFNGWNERQHPFARDAQGTWSVEIELRKGRIYEYGFFVDGNLIVDPKNPLVTDNGKYSILDLAAEVETPGPAIKAGGDLGAVAVAFERFQEKLAVLTKQLQELSIQLARQNELVMKKDIQIEMLRAETDALKNDRMQSQKDLTEARVRLGELTEKYESMKNDRSEKVAVIDQYTRDAATMKKQVSDLQTKVNTILQEKRQATEQLAGALERADSAEKSVTEMNERYQELVKELEEKKGS
ncbi:MAG: hypothetical protein HZA54_16865, partial [Planctomycetes bacterium]|nr:hypothetical protein [Planctomycetota bacterium]